MKRIVLGLAAASLAMWCGGAAWAQDRGASAVLQSYDESGELIGEKSFEVSLGDDNLWHILDGLYEDSEGNTATVMGTGKSDPFISAVVGITDTGAASSFLFTFVIPVIPCPPGMLLNADSSTSVSFSDGATVDGGSMTAFTLPGYFQSFTGPPTTVLSDLGTFPVIFSPGSDTDGPHMDSTSIPDIGYTLLGLSFSFTGSGDSDVFGLTGRVDTFCTAIPEPSSLALVGIAGLAGLGTAIRRRRAS